MLYSKNRRFDLTLAGCSFVRSFICRRRRRRHRHRRRRRSLNFLSFSECVTDQLTDRPTDRPINRQTDRPTDHSTDTASYSTNYSKKNTLFFSRHSLL